MAQPGSRTIFRFADFELDLAAYELRRSGRPVRLERRPMDLLIFLLEHHHQLVSRDRIVERLWGSGVFVDVETGVNTAIRKVRQALNDVPTSPSFLETVSTRGYRFIAPVEVIDAVPAHTPAKAAKIAVLPFGNLSADLEREYLADGLTEETIAALGQVDPEGLSVLGRTTVMRYKKTMKTLEEIGRELKADYLIEGSLRGEARQLRITSRLVRVQDESQIWSASYDCELTNFLAFQRELSGAIAEQVRLRLSPERLDALTKRQSHNPEAFDFYLRGRFFWNQLSPATTRRALEFYAKATERDPDYALAWSGIADAFSIGPITADAPLHEVRPRGQEAISRAVAAGVDLAEVQTSLGFTRFWLDWDFPAAEKAFRRSIEIDSSYSLAHRMLGIVLSQVGRNQEARNAARRARELDPFNAAHYALSGQIAFAARDYSFAVELSRQAIAVDPEFWIGHFQLGQAYEQLGEDELALQAMQIAGRLSHGNSKATALRGYLLAKLKRQEEAREVLNVLNTVSKERFLPPCALALVHLGLGEESAALDWLERAVEVRDVHLTIVARDAKWDAYRSHPRFIAIMQKCGLAPART